MRRRIRGAAVTYAIVALSALACSGSARGDPGQLGGRDSAHHGLVIHRQRGPAGPRQREPGHARASRGEPRATAPSSRPTRAWATRSPAGSRRRASRRRPACCGTSLRARAPAISYPAGSRIARLAAASSAFKVVNGQVQSAVERQLKAGGTQVRLSAGQLPTVTFSDTSSDLYWSFRGTQGLTVTGTGSRKGGRYTGTLTYVIRDSYGFPADDTLDGFGPPMRYLQTACGAPRHAGGARWFPDTVTVTVPFAQPRR